MGQAGKTLSAHRSFQFMNLQSSQSVCSVISKEKAKAPEPTYALRDEPSFSLNWLVPLPQLPSGPTTLPVCLRGFSCSFKDGIRALMFLIGAASPRVMAADKWLQPLTSRFQERAHTKCEEGLRIRPALRMLAELSRTLVPPRTEELGMRPPS